MNCIDCYNFLFLPFSTIRSVVFLIISILWFFVRLLQNKIVDNDAVVNKCHNSLMYWLQWWNQLKFPIDVCYTGNELKSGLSSHSYGHYLQCYFTHTHADNTWNNNAYSSELPCFTLTSSNDAICWDRLTKSIISRDNYCCKRFVNLVENRIKTKVCFSNKMATYMHTPERPLVELRVEATIIWKHYSKRTTTGVWYVSITLKQS